MSDMYIDDVIEELKRLKEEHGNIRMTCTGSTLPDEHGGPIPDVFESTVCNLVVREDGKLGKRVRVYM